MRGAGCYAQQPRLFEISLVRIFTPGSAALMTSVPLQRSFPSGCGCCAGCEGSKSHPSNTSALSYPDSPTGCRTWPHVHCRGTGCQTDMRLLVSEIPGHAECLLSDIAVRIAKVTSHRVWVIQRALVSSSAACSRFAPLAWVALLGPYSI